MTGWQRALLLALAFVVIVVLVVLLVPFQPEPR